IAAGAGNCALNVQKPVIIHNLLQSIRILSDACNSFSMHCIEGIRPNKKRIKENLENSLMLVTALAPRIGYDKAAKIAQKALQEDKTLRQAAIESGILSERDFDKIVNPGNMI
ncbi:MAG: class II fumarate hydratase, partial [Candidatus Omnitrophica bacterium]|nr:class II fumarate hydratase [Candidatus Omnitrophota bacterium]